MEVHSPRRRQRHRSARGAGAARGVERVRRGGVNRCIIIREDSKRLRRRSYYRLVSHPAKSKDVWLDL